MEKDKGHRFRWLALFVLGLGLLVGVVDTSVVNVATPAMMEEFNATESHIAMVVTVYSLVTASFILLFGKVGSRYGFRLLYALGTGLFGLASLLIALSPSLLFVNFMRALAGIGTAMVAASGLALVHSIFKGKDRCLAFGIWGATASLGVAIGPMLGGWAVTHFSWRAAFLINIPICIFVVLGCFLWIAEIKHDQKEAIDFIGAALLGVGLGAVLYALVHAGTLGWWTASTSASFLGISPVPWLLVLGGILIIIAFPTWVRYLKAHDREPIFDIGLLNFHSFRGGMLASLTRQVAQFAPGYALALFLEEKAGWSAEQTGLVFVTSALGAVIAGPLSGVLANRWGTKPVVICGKILMAGAVLWLLYVIGVDINSVGLLLPMFLFGFSIGLAGAQLNTTVMADVPLNRAGDASAAKSSVSPLGNSISAALVAVLITISINDVLIMVLLFIAVALSLAFTLPNVQKGGGQIAAESG
jgi:EmrB/QacA subfamily drug resistance transporter